MAYVDYELLRLHFEDADEAVLRGRTSEFGLMIYAAHLLERIQPKEGARLLDLGCGDGLPMAMMQKMRPDLLIDGIELSQNLARQARFNNHQSKIAVGNILDMHMPAGNYDCIFSFSFLQYIAPESILLLQRRLVTMLRQGGSIMHCSVPDIRLRTVNIAEIQFRKHAVHGWWRTPMIAALSCLRGKKNSYGSNAYWHNPAKVKKQLAAIGKTSALPGDVYYRFDIETVPDRDVEP